MIWKVWLAVFIRRPCDEAFCRIAFLFLIYNKPCTSTLLGNHHKLRLDWLLSTMYFISFNFPLILRSLSVLDRENSFAAAIFCHCGCFVQCNGPEPGIIHQNIHFWSNLTRRPSADLHRMSSLVLSIMVFSIWQDTVMDDSGILMEKVKHFW